MAALIGALRVALSADTAKFSAGMKKAQGQAASSAAAIQKSLGGIQAGMAGFAAAFSVGLLASAIKRSLDYAGSLKEIAQQLGVTTRDLQVFRYAAGQVGVSQEQLSVGLTKLTVTLGKVAAGASAPAKALNAIGISVKDVAGVDTGTAFRKIADGLQKVTDRSQRAAIEVALFGKSGAALDTLLSGGSKAINELSLAADKLGIVLSDEQIQNADVTADKLEALKTVLAARIAGVVADNAGSILSLANSLASLTGEIVRFLGSNPQLALGIIGALLGGRVGGLPGAAAGAIGGVYLGNKMAEGNMDPAYRKKQLNQALAKYRFEKKIFGEKAPNHPSLVAARNEVVKQTQLGQQVIASQRRLTLSVATPTGLDTGNYLAGGGGARKPKRARADNTAADALRDQHDFDQQLRRAQMDVLRATESLATDYVERTQIALQILEAEKVSRDKEHEFNIALFELTDGKQGMSAEQVRQLKAEEAITHELEKEKILQDEETARAEEFAKLQQGDFDRQAELLESRAAIATTAAERRKIELELLRIAYMQKRQALQDVLDTSKNFGELEGARRDIETLDATYANNRKGAMNSTRGPLEEWAATVPQTAAEVNEALEQIAVRGLDGLTDSIMGVIDGTVSLKDAFSDLARSIIADIIRMTIRMLIFKVISGMMGNMNIGGADSYALSGGADFATGGSFTVLGNRGIDKNVMSLNGLPIANVSHGERIGIDATGGDGSGDGGPIEVVVTVEASPDLYVKAAVIADHRIRAATPQIIKGAANATLRAAGRPKLMGR